MSETFVCGLCGGEYTAERHNDFDGRELCPPVWTPIRFFAGNAASASPDVVSSRYTFGQGSPELRTGPRVSAG